MGAESQLQHAIERDVRAGQKRAVLVLHIARLHLLRAHHQRIGKAMLDHAAQAYAGQVFVRRNADIVLICNPSGIERLVPVLDRLFPADAGSMLGQWMLPQDSAALEHYLGQTMVSVTANQEIPTELAAIGRIVGMGQVNDTIQRQMAVHITGGILPLYRELTFSLGALGVRAGTTSLAQSDPYVLRHLAARLDARMIDLLAREFARPGALPPDLPLHLNLAIQSILSPGFLRLAMAARHVDAKLGAVVTLDDAYADPSAFAAARMALRALGVALVIGPASHASILLTRLDGVEPDLVTLGWLPCMMDLPPAYQDGLGTALRRIGPDRMVLHGTISAEAMTWGQTHGISRFQGDYIDGLLAATRLAGCRKSGACTVHQCSARAAATGTSGRAGCRDTARLDRLPGRTKAAA